MKRAKSWLIRWQEHVLWLPMLVAGALAAWVVVGALDRTAVVDQLALLVALPLISLYALAACALAYLYRRRWRRHISEQEQQDWWDRLMSHPHGPLVVYLVDALFSLATLVVLLAFVGRAL